MTSTPAQASPRTDKTDRRFGLVRPKGRTARVLVIMPAGTVYDHDHVRLYPEVLTGTYGNVGDMIVYESTLRLLDYGYVETLSIEQFSDSAIERANREFDFAFLRGSNFIHEQMDWLDAPRILEKLTIPVLAIGVGAQASKRRRISLPAPAVRVWSAIAERCTAIGVRGEFSAEVLHLNGIKNVEIVGCPTMFRARDPNLRLRLPPPSEVKRVLFSLRRETGPDYSADAGSYLARQKSLLTRLDREASLVVSVHGEPEESAFALTDLTRMGAAESRLREVGWFSRDDQAIERIYRSKLRLPRSGEEYDALVKTVDLAIGYRVHGVLPAMARGVPGILVGYDVRTQELAATHKIPLLDESEAGERGLSTLYSTRLFDDWQAAFVGTYQRMRSFLERNGVWHRMG